MKLLIATAAVVCAAAPASAQVQFYDLFYTRYFAQFTANPPTTETGFYFASRLIATSPGDLSSVRMLPPGGPPEIDLPLYAPAYYYFAPAGFFNADSLLAAYPAGTYRFSIAGGTLGEDSGDVERPADPLWAAEIPAFDPETFELFAAFNPGVSQTVRFSGFEAVAGANVSIIFFSVIDPQLGYVVDQAFANTETSTVINAGTLVPGKTYDVYLYYSSRQETANAGFGTATGTVGFDNLTYARLVTFCPADINHDNQVDFFDYLDFVSAFDSESPIADFNGDNQIDFFDYLDFVAAFDQPC
jgi:hypothetical protein